MFLPFCPLLSLASGWASLQWATIVGTGRKKVFHALSPVDVRQGMQISLRVMAKSWRHLYRSWHETRNREYILIEFKKGGSIICCVFLEFMKYSWLTQKKKNCTGVTFGIMISPHNTTFFNSLSIPSKHNLHKLLLINQSYHVLYI